MCFDVWSPLMWQVFPMGVLSETGVGFTWRKISKLVPFKKHVECSFKFLVLLLCSPAVHVYTRIY